MGEIRFLKPAPRPETTPYHDPIATERDVFGLWLKIGAIQRAPRPTTISRTEAFGLLWLVGMLCFCAGFLFGLSHW